MADRTSAGDPARTLSLLWRDPKAAVRGPRPGLSLDQVLAAAVSLADAEGLAAVTVRRVAQALGVAPMSLYTYVPGKAELLDLMLDSVYLAMPRPDLLGLSWRERVTGVAAANRALYQAHPWAASVATGRPQLGPGLMAKYEYELSAFDGLGLGDVDMDAALTFLLGFVQSSARAEADAVAARRDSSMTDSEWWAAVSPYLERVFDAARYPTASRVGSAAGAEYGGAFSPDHAYEFGLRRVLDGLAALISPDGVG